MRRATSDERRFTNGARLRDGRTFRSTSPARTLAFGRQLGHRLEAGDVVALVGDLGSGKTTLAKGIALGLGVADARSRVVSPTFVLVRVYHGRLPIYHLDLHRLHHVAQMREIGWDEYLGSDGVALIEWADRATELLPSERLDVQLVSRGLRERSIRLVPKGRRYVGRWDARGREAGTRR